MISGDISNDKADWRVLSAHVFRPSPDFSVRHFNTHHVNCLIMTFVTALAGVSLWTWDFAHDPSGAETTIWLRLAIVPTALPYMAALWFKVDRRLAFLAALVMFVGWELGFFAIMSRIEGGFVYGLAGFMYFVFMPLLATRCFTFPANAVLIVAIVAFPLLAAAIGDFPLFTADKYAALLVPAGNMSLIATFIMAWLYGANDLTLKALEREATTDTLTGVANRGEFSRLLTEEIDRATRYGRPTTLIMYDVDHFKLINDTFGHDVGDEVLKTIVGLVNQQIRRVDKHGRWGGEEFMVLLPETDLAAALVVAECLCQAIASHGFEQVGSVTASFGVTILGPGDDFDRHVKRADEALYLAKNGGRNRIESVVG